MRKVDDYIRERMKKDPDFAACYDLIKEKDLDRARTLKDGEIRQVKWQRRKPLTENNFA